MRYPLLLPALLTAACAGAKDRPRDSTAAARLAVAPAAARPAVAIDSAGMPPEDVGGPRRDLAAGDPWLLAADSAIRRHLGASLFLADRSREFSDCSDDDGSDNPTIGAAAVSARPVRRTEAVLEPFAYGRPTRRASYDVEVKSVAIVVPQWIAKFPTDSTMINTEPYEGVIGMRTDTFRVSILQRVDSAEHAPWEACEPGGPAVSEGDGPGFWFFAHAADQPNKEMRVVRWIPADGSWAKVVALAESARKALGDRPLP